MKRFLVGASCGLLLVGCGPGDNPNTPEVLELERWSPPQPTSHDVFLAARGDIVVLAHRISRDAGSTWAALPASLGEPTRVSIVGNTITLFADGLVRWDLASDGVATVSGAPSYTTDRTWRADPLNGRFIAFDAVENKIAVESANGWVSGTLPQPAPTETRPYIRDIESNGSTIMTTSVWGMHRSLDGGATWQLVTATFPGGGRDLIVLGDGRFALVGGATAYAFAADGTSAGTLPINVGDGVATVCEDGAIVAGTKLTRDFGASWQTLVPASDLSMMVPRAGCGGGRYWVSVISDAWGYRLVRFDAVGADGVAAGNWDGVGDQQWANGGPPITRTIDGTFLVAGLALAPGAQGASAWTLHEIPARTWASGVSLFGVAKQTFYTSSDGGMTWSATAAAGLTVTEPEAFARASDGTVYVSEFTGASDSAIDAWHSIVWKSGDGGASWSIAYDATATRVAGGDEIVGEVHRFVGITDGGAWIATDAVSSDGGSTWQETEVVGDRGLAHLTSGGSLVTGGADEKLWRVYDEAGLGALRATYQIEVDGEPIPAQQLRSVAFDDEGYAYIARGSPRVQVWRSDRPLDLP